VLAAKASGWQFSPAWGKDRTGSHVCAWQSIVDRLTLRIRFLVLGDFNVCVGRPPDTRMTTGFLKHHGWRTMAIFYVSPTGSGSRSGSSLSNAGTISSLPKLIANAGAGDEVRLIADKGAHKVTQQIIFSDGGAAGAPVTIRGVSSSGLPMKATFVGTRAANWQPGLPQGSELFRLLSGANHLAFSDLTTTNFGNGVFRFGGDLQNISIKRVTAANVTRFVENHVSGGATSASINGLTVQDVTVSGYSQNAIRVKYNTRNVTLQNIVGDSMRQNGGLYIHRVSLDGTVHDVLLDRLTMKNNYGRGSSGDYWNGDGFVAEGGTYNLIFRDTLTAGNTDAGYDIKGNNVTMIRAQAIGSTKNFRFWGDNVRVTDSVSTDPRYFGGTVRPVHFHAAGKNGTTATLDNFRYSVNSGIKVFDLSNGGAKITLTNMAMPSASLILYGGGSTIQMLDGSATTSLAASEPMVSDLAMYGTTGADTLLGGAGADLLMGGKGNDVYLVNHAGDRPIEQGGEGNDLVRTTLPSYTLGDHIERLSYAGAGNFSGTGNSLRNAIAGGAGNDWLSGATGNDTLTGGEGADIYYYSRGGGNDTIYNGDNGGADRLLFGANIAEDQLWFAQNGGDLLVTLRNTGSSDTVRIKGWYSDPDSRLGSLPLSDGQVLEATRVQQLVQAMADFSTSSGAPTGLSGSEQQTVAAVIAANWKSA
jgi:Ca2+-binding RTX toxin-like protein